MTRHVQLDPVAHRHLRIDTRHLAALGDDVMVAATCPDEFRDLQAHYPVVFRVDGTKIQPLALLGLQQGCNLFLDAGGWAVPHVPLAMARRPFLIGVGEAPTIHVDLDDPRVRVDGEAGEALFLPHGGSTPYLQHVQEVLQRLHAGLARLPAFCDALRAHGLLEPFALDVRLDDGQPHRLSGFHIIDEARLRALDTDAVTALHAAGHLEPLYMAIASLSRFRDLIDRMNRRRVAA